MSRTVIVILINHSHRSVELSILNQNYIVNEADGVD
jgi:hypothetical protein